MLWQGCGLSPERQHRHTVLRVGCWGPATALAGPRAPHSACGPTAGLRWHVRLPGCVLRWHARLPGCAALACAHPWVCAALACAPPWRVLHWHVRHPGPALHWCVRLLAECWSGMCASLGLRGRDATLACAAGACRCCLQHSCNRGNPRYAGGSTAAGATVWCWHQLNQTNATKLHFQPTMALGAGSMSN